MDQTQAGDVIRVDQIAVILPQLARLELALVDQGSGWQGADVKPDAGDFKVQRVGHPLSKDVGLALELLLRPGLVIGDNENL